MTSGICLNESCEDYEKIFDDKTDCPTCGEPLDPIEDDADDEEEEEEDNA